MSEITDGYIPYEATAQAIVDSDDGVELFLCSLFPDADLGQIAMFKMYSTAKVLEGIHYGLELNTEDPISQIQVHSQGYRQGYDQATEDIGKLGPGNT